MAKYIIKRILTIIPMMCVVIFIIFALTSLSNVDPGRMKLGPEATDEQVAAINASFGLDKPMIVRYFRFLGGILKGDLGQSWYRDEPVIVQIQARWPYTIKLTLLSIGIAIIIGIPIGVLAAVKQYSFADRFFTILSMIIAAIPTFCMATLFVLAFSVKLGWVPASGVSQGWKNWILPSVTLGTHYAASFIRFTRSSMLDTIRQDYIRTVRAKGVKESKVIWGHAFRNALLPLITITGTMLGGLLGGAVIMESVFVIPGLGTLVQQGINQHDVPVVVGSITILATVFMLIMLVVDILYAVVDPRIRAKYQAGSKKKKKAKAAPAVKTEGGAA